MSSDRWNDRDFVLQNVKQYGKALKSASQELRNDREIVLEAVKQTGWALEYASQELRNDREIVLEAVKQHGYALVYASQELQNDREIVLEAVKQKGYALEYASQELLNDREIVLEAVKQNRQALQFASQELQNDREIVLEAVKQKGYALVYASQELRNDREFVLKAMKQNGQAFTYASEELKRNVDWLLEFNNENDIVNKYIQESFFGTFENTKQVISRNVKAFLLLEPYRQKDRTFVLQIVKQNGLVLKYTSQELRNDKEIVLEAMKQNEVAFEYASEELKINAEWLLKTCSENNRLKKYIQEELFGTIEKAKQGITRNVKIFLLLKPSLQQEPEIINSIFQEGPKQFSFASNFDEIIEYYSNNFISNQNAFDFYLYSSIQPTPSRTVFSIFTNYPKEMTTDYYLFSDTIYNFVDQLQNTLESTHYEQLKSIVDNIVQDFPIEKLSESCFDFIVKFLNDWKQMKDFPRLTSIQQLTQQNLSKYDMELDKIRQCCQIAKSQPQFKTIHFISLLGMGMQGVVLRCLYKNYGIVACKFSFESTKDRKRVDEQFKVLKDPRVKGHVIDCIECNTIEWNGSHYPYIIMEMGRGTLKEEIYSIHSKKILKKAFQSKFLEKQDLFWILNCFIDVLKAVTVLHDMSISHRDLKPENVILAQDGKSKLIDLDTSRNIQYLRTISMNVGTIFYLAPEVQHAQVLDVGNNTTVSKFCDVFSLGCTFMKMLTNCSLILDGTYLNSKEQDLYENQHQTTNTGGMNYFSEKGEYFYVAVATPHGESKLHQALYKELDKHIDPSWKVNDILGRCLMTMIQKDIETRRDCVKYIPILQAVKQSLEKGINNPDFSSLDLSILKEYQPSFIEKMMKENRRLKQDNDNLLSENRQIKDKYEKLLAYMWCLLLMMILMGLMG